MHSNHHVHGIAAHTASSLEALRAALEDSATGNADVTPARALVCCGTNFRAATTRSLVAQARHHALLYCYLLAAPVSHLQKSLGCAMHTRTRRSPLQAGPAIRVAGSGER